MCHLCGKKNSHRCVIRFEKMVLCVECILFVIYEFWGPIYKKILGKILSLA